MRQKTFLSDLRVTNTSQIPVILLCFVSYSHMWRVSFGWCSWEMLRWQQQMVASGTEQRAHKFRFAGSISWQMGQIWTMRKSLWTQRHRKHPPPSDRGLLGWAVQSYSIAHTVWRIPGSSYSPKVILCWFSQAYKVTAALVLAAEVTVAVLEVLCKMRLNWINRKSSL